MAALKTLTFFALLAFSAQVSQASLSSWLEQNLPALKESFDEVRADLRSTLEEMVRPSTLTEEENEEALALVLADGVNPLKSISESLDRAVRSGLLDKFTANAIFDNAFKTGLYKVSNPDQAFTTAVKSAKEHKIIDGRTASVLRFSML